MSMLKKTKEFFGLAPYETDHDDAYYADEPRYEAAPAYAPEYRDREYGYTPEPVAPAAPAPRSYQSTIVPVELNSFEDAQIIGASFRDGDAVVFDMSLLSRDESRRIVDFAAGLCFALRGQMKKIDNLTFAVIPELSTVTTAELERAARLR
ncbi:cell division protein SepF [Corynebacterium callunae]|uniref:cell division protein SepF n=1 Tax=Corynebacterium callunae TaxID=1721 RepID=UPI003981A9A5